MAEELPFGIHKGRTLQSLVLGTPKEKSYVEWMAGYMTGPWKTKALAALGYASTAPEDLTIFVETASSWLTLRGVSDERVVKYLRERIDGFGWHAKSQSWRIPQAQLHTFLEVASSYCNVELDYEAQELLEEERERRSSLETIRQKTQSHLQVPTLLPLLPYQVIGVEFGLASGGRFLNADAPGVGKTAQAIGMHLMLKSPKTLVVCPAGLKVNWKREFLNFGGIEPVIWEGKRCKGDINAPVHIINYDIFLKHRPTLESIGFTLLILDECHYLKNRTAKRTAAIFGGKCGGKVLKPFRTPYAVLLTGTPVLNRPGELFPLLHYLDKDRFKDWTYYANRYGAWPANDFKRRPSTPQNLGELYEKTRDLVIRRKLQDVVKDMPPKMVSDLWVDMSPEQEREYRVLFQQLMQEWDEDAANKRKPSLLALMRLNEFLNAVKLPKVFDMIDAILEDENRAVLVFCTRRLPLQKLLEKYKGRAVYVDGTMSADQKQAQVDAIQQGRADVGCLSIKAAGVGYTMTRADTVIFLDQDMVPANHSQAENRSWRLGQLNPVHVYYLLCPGTTDEHLREINRQKLDVASQIMDGETTELVREKSVFYEFIRKVRSSRYASDSG